MKIKIKQSGQSLVEVIISVLIIGLVMTGLTKVVVLSLKNIDFSQNKNLSLALARSKLEELRKERDSTNWEVFFDSYRTVDTEVDSNLGTNGTFTRETTYIAEPDNDEKLTINVVVSWQDSGGEHSSSISGVLTQWR